MQRFDEGPLKEISDSARDSVVQHLNTASDADKLVFVQVECTRAIVQAVQSLDIQGAKAEVITEIKKIPRPKQGSRRVERGGLIAVGGVIGGAIGELIMRLRS